MSRFKIPLLALAAILLLRSWPAYKWLLDLTTLNHFVILYRIGYYLLPGASAACVAAIAISYDANLRRERE